MIAFGTVFDALEAADAVVSSRGLWVSAVVDWPRRQVVVRVLVHASDRCVAHVYLTRDVIDACETVQGLVRFVALEVDAAATRRNGPPP